MRVAIMQPYLFPYLGYYQLINSVDKFVFYDDVTFIKQGWINRNNILLNNKKFAFTVPLKNISSFSKINETFVSDKPQNWNRKLLVTIAQAYKKAPYFSIVYPFIEEVIGKCIEESISITAIKSIYLVLDYLSLNKEIVPSSSIYNNNILKSTDRIIDICQKEKASTYINVMSGSHLYKVDKFGISGLELKFLTPVLEPYVQYNNDFLGGLSIIDVLMFCSADEVRKMLNNYQLN